MPSKRSIARGSVRVLAGVIGTGVAVLALGAAALLPLPSLHVAPQGRTVTPVPADQQRVVSMVHETVGAAIPSLRADPASAAAVAPAEAALVQASKITTGIAAGVLMIGLAATLALPPTPVPDTSEPPAARRRRPRERIRTPAA